MGLIRILLPPEILGHLALPQAPTRFGGNARTLHTTRTTVVHLDTPPPPVHTSRPPSPTYHGCPLTKFQFPLVLVNTPLSSESCVPSGASNGPPGDREAG